MSDERYPLEAARTVRGHAVEQAEAALSAAISDLEAADEALARAREALRSHDERRLREGEEAKQREDAGGTAAELARSSAFRSRRQREADGLSEAVREAEAAREAFEEAVGRARRALGAAKADQDVVERHHDRFRSAERKARQAREELEAEDLATARRHQE